MMYHPIRTSPMKTGHQHDRDSCFCVPAREFNHNHQPLRRSASQQKYYILRPGVTPEDIEREKNSRPGALPWFEKAFEKEYKADHFQRLRPVQPGTHFYERGGQTTPYYDAAPAARNHPALKPDIMMNLTQNPNSKANSMRIQMQQRPETQEEMLAKYQKSLLINSIGKAKNFGWAPLPEEEPSSQEIRDIANDWPKAKEIDQKSLQIIDPMTTRLGQLRKIQGDK